MVRMDFLTVSGILAVARDDYKNGYNEYKKEYEQRLKEIKENYKPNTELYNQEVQRAEVKFNTNVYAKKEEVKQFALRNIEELRESEYAKVRSIDTSAMEKLSAVAGLPLTANELGVLQARFAPNGEYWATRMIADMAEKNSIKPSLFQNSASLDTKLNVLSQLETQLNDLLEKYNGEHHYGTEVLLHDSVLLRAERVYTNGWNTEMEDSQVARRAFLQLKGKSPVEQGIALSNIINNTTAETKIALFFEMANDNSFIDDGALKWAGIKEEFEAYKAGEHKDYSEARKAIEKTLAATSKEEVAATVGTMTENKYYQEMLKKAGKNHFPISEYMGNEGVQVD